MPPPPRMHSDGDEFVAMRCPVCRVTYALERGFRDFRRNAPPNNPDRDWFCPNGHRLSFTESAIDRAKREAANLRQQLAERDDALRCERQQTELERRRTAAYKGQVTKMRKRAKGGVCPECNRYFPNVHAHMCTKHPDYSEQAPELEVVEGGKK